MSETRCLTSWSFTTSRLDGMRSVYGIIISGYIDMLMLKGIGKAAGQFRALGDRTRLRILCLLMKRKLCVCQIMDILGMGQSRISRHLGILKQAGLVEETRIGKWVIYKVPHQHHLLLDYIRNEMSNEKTYLQDKSSIQKTMKKKLCPVTDDRGEHNG